VQIQYDPKSPKEMEKTVILFGCFVIAVCLIAFMLLYILNVWNDYQFENQCVYEGIEYQLGNYRPDGECICVYGRTKQKWVWNCRESWGR